MPDCAGPVLPLGLDRRGATVVLGACLLALAVRAYVLWEMRASPFLAVPIVDAKEYHREALLLMQGRGLLTLWVHHSPIYPFFLVAVYSLFGVSPWPVFIIQAFLGALTAGLCSLATIRASGSLVGAAAAGLAAGLCWPMLYPVMSLLPQTLEMFLSALVLLALSSRGAPTLRTVLAAGCAMALVCSLRSQMLPAALFLALALRFAWREGTWRAAFAFAVPVMVLSAAWSVYLASRGFETLLQPASGFNLYLGNHAGASGRAAEFPGLEYYLAGVQGTAAGCQGPLHDSCYAGLVKDWMLSAPADFLGLWLRKLAMTLASCEIPAGDAQPWHEKGRLLPLRGLDFGLLLGMGLTGLILRVRSREGPARASAAFLTAGFASLAVAAVAGRYRAPLLPALALGVGFHADAVVSWARERRLRQAAALIAAAGLIWLMSAGASRLAGLEPRRHLGIALSMFIRADDRREAEVLRGRELLHEWTTAHPDDDPAALHLGLTQIHLGDWAAARETMARLAERRGTEAPELDAATAWLSALGGDLAGARDSAAAGWRRDPRSLEACLRAVLYARLADPTVSPLERLCRCPLDPAGRLPVSPDIERTVAAMRRDKGRMDLQLVLTHIEERYWASRQPDYPAEEMRKLIFRRPWPMFRLPIPACSEPKS